MPGYRGLFFFVFYVQASVIYEINNRICFVCVHVYIFKSLILMNYTKCHTIYFTITITSLNIPPSINLTSLASSNEMIDGVSFDNLTRATLYRCHALKSYKVPPSSVRFLNKPSSSIVNHTHQANEPQGS